MATLSFFLCNSKQRGKRIVPRRGKGDTHTQLNGKLNCFAYECENYNEFTHLQERLGHKDGWYAGVLIKNDDGTFRFPEVTDLVTKTSSPAASADAGRVVVTSSQPEEGTLSTPDILGGDTFLTPDPEPKMEVDFELDEEPEGGLSHTRVHDIVQVREYIIVEGTKRLSTTAAKFGIDVDVLREAIESPGSGLINKAGGWISAPK